MLRLTLISAGISEGQKRGVFGDDGPLEPRSKRLALSVAKTVARADLAFVAPSRRASETAQIIGLTGSIDPLLADQQFGVWSGDSLPNVQEHASGEVARWVSEPDFAPTGGESVSRIMTRSAEFLDTMKNHSGHVVALTHGPLIRAAIVNILSAPASAFWAIDAGPLCVTDLRHDGRRWALRSHGAPDPV